MISQLSSAFIYPLALLLGVMTPHMAYASISPGSANLSGATGTEVTLEFSVGAADGECNWSIVPTNSTTALTPAQLLSAGLSLVSANGGEQMTISYRPAAAHSACPSNTAYRLMATPVAGGPPFFSTLNLCKQTLETVVKPIEVVIVADVSGSMGEVANCDCGAGPRATTEPCTATENPDDEIKMTYLKRELNAAMTVLKPYFSDPAGQNKVALVTFETIPRLEQGLTAFNSVDLTDKINALVPLGVTAMGEGIRMAANQFSPNAANPDNDPIRVILLFTNGIQNEGDLVSVSGGNVMIGATALNDIRRNIKIIPYAIFTPEGSYAQTLRDMAAANGMSSDNLTTTPYICQIDRPLRQNWVNSADALGSPKMVHFVSNTTASNNGTENFTITENLENIAVGVSLNQNAAIQSVKIEKLVAGTWTDITSKGIMTPGGVSSAYQAIHFKFPLTGVSASASGDYRATLVVNKNAVSYDVSAVVDDKGLKDYFFNSPLLGAGEPMYLGAHLLQKAATPSPVTNATVKAIIYKPKKSLNNGFAAKDVPRKFIKKSGGPWGKLLGYSGSDKNSLKAVNGTVLPTIVVTNDKRPSRWDGGYFRKYTITHPTLPSIVKEGNNMTEGEKKHLVLLSETGYHDVFDIEPVATVPLQHTGDGTYAALWDGADKTGIYHVRFEATGNTAQVGNFFRFENKTTVVRFGTPDRRRSCLTVLYETPHVLMMRPVDTEGNLLGPNQIEAIRIEMSNGFAYDLTDNLDGKYYCRLETASDPDPNIRILIHGRTLYNGPLSGIHQRKSYFNINGGITRPYGASEQHYQQGWYGEMRLGTRVYRRLNAEIKGHYSVLKGKQTPDVLVNQPDFTSAGAGAGLALRQWLGFNFLTGVYAQIDAHAGFYQFDDGLNAKKWKAGLDAGVMLIKPLNHRLNVTLNGSYFSMKAKPVTREFLTAGLGLQWRF